MFKLISKLKADWALYFLCTIFLAVIFLSLNDPILNPFLSPFDVKVLWGGAIIAICSVAILLPKIRNYPNFFGAFFFIFLFLSFNIISKWAYFYITLIAPLSLAASAYGLQRLLEKRIPKITLAESAALYLIIQHHYLYILSLVGILNTYFSVLCLAFFALTGLSFFLRDFRKSRIIMFKTQEDATQLIYAATIALVLFFLLIGAVGPASYADALVYRIPWLIDVMKTGTLPEAGLNWNWLLPQPISLVALPNYFLFLERGAALTAYCYFLILAALTMRMLKHFDVNNKLPVLLLISIPPIWILGAIFYTDIALTAYVLTGILLLLGSAKDDTSAHRFIGAGLCWGFAFSIKLNSLLIIAPLGLLMFVFLYRLNLKKILATSLGFLIASGPWVWESIERTGNPFYPFFSLLTKTAYRSFEVFTPGAQEVFKYPKTILDPLKFPYDFAFKTSQFGEYLDLTGGPQVLLLFLSFLLFLQFRKLSLSIRIVTISSFLSFGLLLLSARMAIFRYWLPGFCILFLICAGLPFKQNRKASVLLVAVLNSLILTFIILIGAKLNYGLAGGFEMDRFKQRITDEEYYFRNTEGVPKFVNTHLKPGETVLVTDYFHHHLINAPVFMASSKNSLFGQIGSRGNLEALAARENVRFWIYTEDAIQNLGKEIPGLENYLSKSPPIYSSGRFSVADLKNKLQLIPNNTFFEVSGDFQASADAPLSRIVNCDMESDAVFLDLEKLEGTKPQGLMLVHFVFLSDRGDEISRSVSEVKIRPSIHSYHIRSTINQECRQMQILIAPWRHEDGVVKFLKLKSGGLKHSQTGI